MGVIVTHRAIDFAQNFYLVQLTILTLHTVSAVSYTHLDVYKRQALSD